MYILLRTLESELRERVKSGFAIFLRKQVLKKGQETNFWSVLEFLMFCSSITKLYRRDFGRHVFAGFSEKNKP